MAVNPVVAKHLRSARAELVAERDAALAQFDRDIAQIDSMLQGYAGEGAPRLTTPRKATTPRKSADGSPSMRQIVMDYLAVIDDQITTAHVVEKLAADRPEWAPASVRSLLARMVKNGELISVKRGVYRLPTPEDASGPAADARPEVGVTTEDEGGEADDPTGHNPDHVQSGWDRDRGGHPDTRVTA